MHAIDGCCCSLAICCFFPYCLPFHRSYRCQASVNSCRVESVLCVCAVFRVLSALLIYFLSPRFFVFWCSILGGFFNSFVLQFNRNDDKTEHLQSNNVRIFYVLVSDEQCRHTNEFHQNEIYRGQQSRRAKNHSRCVCVCIICTEYGMSMQTAVLA